MDVHEGTWHHHQSTIRLARLCGNNRFYRGCRVEQEDYPVNAWRNLLKQLQPFSSHCRLHKDETGDVATRSREARDEVAADRIDNVYEDDRDGGDHIAGRSRPTPCRLCVPFLR